MFPYAVEWGWLAGVLSMNRSKVNPHPDAVQCYKLVLIGYIHLYGKLFKYKTSWWTYFIGRMSLNPFLGPDALDSLY